MILLSGRPNIYQQPNAAAAAADDDDDDDVDDDVCRHADCY